MADPPELRRAAPADAAALLRLRELMLAEMGASVSDVDWKRPALDWFAEMLRRPAEFAAFVVDDQQAGVVACAAGSCDSRAPAPGNPAGCHGHVFNMSTDPAHRGRGHGRRCLEALLDWFRASTDARVVHLNATEDGIRLYRSAGFTEPAHPALRLDILS